MLTPDELKRKIGPVLRRIDTLLRGHEEKMHDGEPCMVARHSLVLVIGQHLGVELPFEIEVKEQELSGQPSTHDLAANYFDRFCTAVQDVQCITEVLMNDGVEPPDSQQVFDKIHDEAESDWRRILGNKKRLFWSDYRSLWAKTLKKALGRIGA